jgi:hypothetical protein
LKSFLKQKAVFLCLALSLGQGLFAQDLKEVKEKITQVIDLVMLQTELNLAANNGGPDMIQIGEGVFDLSVLDQDLTYAPLPEPRVTKEERYPITIVGAGVGKTIFDAGKSVRKLWLTSAQLKNDMGVSITVKGITFRNVGGVYVETQAGNVEFINNTLVENTTLAFPNCTTGAGLCLKTCAIEATAIIYNNILWNNACKSKAGIDLRIDNDPDHSFQGFLLQPDGIGSSVLVSNNIVRNTSITISNAVTVKNQLLEDPLLDSKFKLQAKSPAIDAGTKYGHGVLGAGKDFAQKERELDGNGDSNKVVDLGAIEYKRK